MKRILQKIDNGLAYGENFLIFLTLGLMIGLSFLQVLLRNFFESGILWADIFLRHLVLWVGFIGASLATRNEKHINVDILTRLVPERVVPFIKIVVDLVTVAVCIILAHASYIFLTFEIEAETIIFENIPAWYFQIIMPVGFFLIGIRFIIKIFEQFFVIFSKNELSKE
jgi:TRAP-type C4-dicarboxylate transport system permease small subunit